METEKLYYQDPFLREFTARILACAPEKDGRWAVTLDRTAFYPEGGGQPADRGTLGGADVIDVQEENGVILHVCSQPLRVGAEVSGQLDWARRFDHMQQHSGEHIISGILCARYHCDNVGFHMGAQTVTIDYNAPISWEQALEAEREANQAIYDDVPAQITFPSREELAQLAYRSKKELTGAVRIVAFPGADCCACCGTHVLRAGQVGLIKVLSCQKFREGVRLEIVCGRRALDYLSAVYEQDRAVGQALSVKPQDTAAAVQRLTEELESAKQRMTQLEDASFAAIAAEYAGRGDVVLFQPPTRPDGVRKLADAVSKTCGGLAAVFAGPESDRFAYALVHGRGADIAPLVKELNRALNGRGGGRNGFAQGSVQARQDQIAAFFASRS